MSDAGIGSAVDTGILLEAGTNEAEVLVFFVRGKRFGVNVAKVREVLPIEDVTDVPRSDPAVDGLVDIRETVVPLVNLETYLYGDYTPQDEEGDSLVLLEFNAQQIAFRVERIERIYRVSWQDTLPAPQLGKEATPITSVLRQESGLVPLLDFESICATIGVGGMSLMHGSYSTEEVRGRADMPIVYADDSQLISEMIKDTLVAAGYTSLKGFSDGEDAWRYLEETARDCDAESLAQKVACVVTDIEMPRMDGLSLTKQIRQHPAMTELPVIVFSSIASKDNEKKGIQVGASQQVSKPHYDSLLEAIAESLDNPSKTAAWREKVEMAPTA